MAKNKNLHEAKKAKQDEFYTQLTDIEKELYHYKEHFKDKIVFLNCDDPEYSNFWKYFQLKFHELGLKKLISTHYAPGEKSYKMEIVSTDLETGQTGIPDYVKTPLEGDGDFRSPECVEILKEADMVISNPPWSLFRDYIAQLIEHDKEFLVIGNKNAITYKEIFPLLKNNKVWLGFGSPSEFNTPDGMTKKVSGLGRWYTNLDIPKRHENLDLIRKYSPEKYPKYDNYDAINVDKVVDIPCDYFESWGVPEAWFNENLIKEEWAVTRKSIEDDIEYVWILPIGDNPVKHLYNNKPEGYVPAIENYIKYDDSCYCSGVIGVPITYLDKHNPEQAEIVNPGDFNQLTHNEINAIIAQQAAGSRQQAAGSRQQAAGSRQQAAGHHMSSLADTLASTGRENTPECLSDHSILQRSNGSADYIHGQIQSRTVCDKRDGCICRIQQEYSRDISNGIRGCQTSNKRKEYICSSIHPKYCSGLMGVPITFLDKYNPTQSKIIGMDLNASVDELGIKAVGNKWVELYKKQGGKGHITANMHSLVYRQSGMAVSPYRRIIICNVYNISE